ncbi:LysR family transcriptional regulator [Nocardiopsis sp. NRRL B-16309]|uniref:LysR family transcriptional regulator n=1 Tax=Nocardiopsis sp. NRRL B-16309 TaxID=1519494 RepID=UPI0006AF5F5D|nr:LysR family transcriptional regulator [Nocardiopsis sp. NRRL B-16309]KOX11895.1 LysR family transcriptional regulator [Nocardiopsis sp. NRRL B-16309]
MDTRLLRTFTALARTENFTAAAEELHLAQSTVTVHIRDLEKELGTRLFDRLPRGARLTSHGHRLLARAEEVLDAEARLRAAADEDSPLSGRVLIAAGETLCSSLLPGVVADLRAAEPGIDVRIHASGTAEAVEGLRSGRVDVALLLEEEAGAADVVVEVVTRLPLVLVAAPGHPLAALGRPVTPTELAATDVFLLEEGCSYSDALARDLAALPGARPRTTRFGSAEAARTCVAAGLGVALLPRVGVDQALADGRLTVLEGPGAPDVAVLLARHRARWASPAANAVTGALERGLRRGAAGGGRVLTRA